MSSAEARPQLSFSPEVLAALVAMGDEINASLDLDEVLEKAAAHIKRLIDYEIFAVLLLDERTNELYFRFDIGHRDEVVKNWRIPLSKGLTGAAAAFKQPIRVDDVSRDPRYINALDSVRSELAVPLLFQGKCIGVLDIQSNLPAFFSAEHQNILSLLASRLAIAIENARLFEHTREQTASLLLLHEVAREASSILDVKLLLRRAAELTKRVMDYHIFSIFLYDERTDTFQHRMKIKFGVEVEEKAPIAGGTGIVGACAALRQPVVVPDVSRDPRYIVGNPESRSELAVPMIHQDRVIGVLDLESPQLAYFSPEHVRALSILAAHLAVSLENARLYEQVARDEARMEQELQAARRIQATLLPRAPAEDYGLEIAARYTSARELGGDLYDFLRYDPQQLGVALGDVSGKGTAAALYGAVAIGILRSLSPQKLCPGEMLRRLNDLICQNRIEGRFMTLCYATWNKRYRTLRVASAGQSQPLMWRRSACEKLDLSGIPLGIYPGQEYDEWSTKLQPEDILVLYSDGLSETTNTDGEQFGFDRLRELLCRHSSLAAEALADRILTEVEHFCEACPAADDRALVILKVKPAPDTPAGPAPDASAASGTEG